MKETSATKPVFPISVKFGDSTSELITLLKSLNKSLRSLTHIRKLIMTLLML
jgi:hypothetical protein